MRWAVGAPDPDGCGAATPRPPEGAAGATFSTSGGALSIGKAEVSAGFVITACPARTLPTPSMTIRSSGLEPILDDDEGARRRSQLDRAHLDPVFGADDGDLVLPLRLRHRALRDDDRLLDLLPGPHARVLSRPKELIGIGKERLHRQRARGRIDPGADDGEVPRVRKDAAIGEDELDRVDIRGMSASLGFNSLELGKPRSERDVLALGQRHDDAHRIDLRNSREQCGLALADEVADTHLRDAGDPVDGRGDPGVAEIEDGRLELALRRGDLPDRRIPGGDRVVEILLAHGLFGDERGVPSDVGSGLLESGFGLGQRALGLKLGGFVRLRIDHEEELARLDAAALSVVLLEQDPLDAGSCVGIHIGVESADVVRVRGHVPPGDGGDRYDGGRRGRGGLLAMAARREERDERDVESGARASA